MPTPAHGCLCRTCGRTYQFDEREMVLCGWGPSSDEWAEARAAGKECDWQFAPVGHGRYVESDTELMAAEEALAEYEEKGGTPLAEIKTELGID